MKTLDFFTPLPLRDIEGILLLFCQTLMALWFQTMQEKRLIYDSFKDRLGTANQPQMVFDLPSVIQPTPGLEELSAPFTIEEIDAVVKHLPIDKAPRPDGFNGQFLKSCWHIMKEDIYQLCFDFHDGSLNLESINMGCITLIPKVATSETMNDYRPITLLNCVLKIVTKLLADRLQKVVLKIVHKNQYGFLKGRTIQDCLAWDFEFIHQCQSSGQEILLLKLDFSKAFDTIEHNAMIKIMKQMGFDNKWLQWMENIFSSGKSAVLLNSIPGRQFFAREEFVKEILCLLSSLSLLQIYFSQQLIKPLGKDC
jgi:hypothetical protein